MSDNQSNVPIAVEWLWSHRGKNIWWPRNVLITDSAAPKLTGVEANSIFNLLLEKGLISVVQQHGQEGFILQEAKDRDWNALIAQLKGETLVAESFWGYFDNTSKLLAGVAFVCWMIQEWIVPHNRVFLFLAIATGLADVFYLLFHKMLPHRKPLTVSGWVIYLICMVLIYANHESQPPMAPVPTEPKTAHWTPPQLPPNTEELQLPPWSRINFSEWKTNYTNWDALGYNGFDHAIRMKVFSNRFYMRADVQTTSEPKLGAPIKIRMDEITGIPASWDCNMNSNRFEIVDDRIVPVFQVSYAVSNQIIIHGIFISDGWIWSISNQRESGNLQIGFDPFQLGLKPMFIYPSTGHIGELSKD